MVRKKIKFISQLLKKKESNMFALMVSIFVLGYTSLSKILCPYLDLKQTCSWLICELFCGNFGKQKSRISWFLSHGAQINPAFLFCHNLLSHFATSTAVLK